MVKDPKPLGVNENAEQAVRQMERTVEHALLTPAPTSCRCLSVPLSLLGRADEVIE